MTSVEISDRYMRATCTGLAKTVYHALVPEPLRIDVYRAQNYLAEIRKPQFVLTEIDGLHAKFLTYNRTERHICARLGGEKEPLVFLLSQIQKGVNFLDVGANTGLVTVFAGLKGAFVDAIEPHPFTAKRLRTNIGMNQLDNFVATHEAAVGVVDSGEGMFGEVVMVNDVGCTPSMRKTAKGCYFGSLMTGIDSMVEQGTIRHPDVMKIDVEGAELGVLRSAKGTLTRFCPKILLEIHTTYLPAFGHSEEMVRGLLREYGYIVTKEWPRGGQTLVWCEHRK